MVNHFRSIKKIYEDSELLQELKRLRTNYDYPFLNLNDLVDHWFVLETFKDNIKTKYGTNKKMMIISELSDPRNPESELTGKKFRVIVGSKMINKVLDYLRESGKELTVLPMIMKVIKTKIHNSKFRYEFWTDLD